MTIGEKEVTVSVLDPADGDTVSELCRLEEECFGSEAWSRESIGSFAENENVVTVVVRLGGDVAASASAIMALDEAEITKAAVFAAYRRRGLARLALTELEDICRKRGVGRLLLEVREGNVPARNLYASLGFTQYSTRKFYYSAPREDAVLMEKRI